MRSVRPPYTSVHCRGRYNLYKFPFAMLTSWIAKELLFSDLLIRNNIVYQTHRIYVIIAQPAINRKCFVIIWSIAQLHMPWRELYVYVQRDHSKWEATPWCVAPIMEEIRVLLLQEGPNVNTLASERYGRFWPFSNIFMRRSAESSYLE